MKSSEREGYVYLAAQVSGHLVKIGFSIQPRYRAAAVGHGKGMTALIVFVRGTLSDEKEMHRCFATQLRSGREWFEPNADMLRCISYMNRHKIFPPWLPIKKRKPRGHRKVWRPK